MTGIVIIGAGECGVRAAFALRQQGYSNAITLIGEESALPYERPPLSKEMVPKPKPIRPREAYREAAIDLRLGMKVNKIDRSQRVVECTGSESLSYDKLLLTTGARARRFPGAEACLTLRTETDAELILSRLGKQSHIGLVGGGFIGLELAATARRAGTAVTVIEAGPRLLGRAIPGEIASVVQARHEAAGVELLIGTGVERVDNHRAWLSDGTTRDFDFVVAGVGSEPVTELATDAGLAVNNGVVVDKHFRTDDARVFAAGDCCYFPWRGRAVRLESWRAAQDQGAFAAAMMLDKTAVYNKVPWFWSEQFDLVLQVAGLFNTDANVHHRGGDGECRIVFQCDREDRLSAVAGIGPGNAVAKDIRLFEKLIERNEVFDVDRLCDPTFPIKRLLKAG